MPDLFVTRLDSCSSSSAHAHAKPVAAKLGEVLIAIGHTSKSTRSHDMVTKWNLYASSGIQIYIIVDLYPFRKTEDAPIVIVGSLTEQTGFRPAPNGYPGRYQPRRRTRSIPALYYKREYNNSESIVIDWLPELDWPSHLITPDVLRSSSQLQRLVKEKRKEQAQERMTRPAAETALAESQKREREKDAHIACLEAKLAAQEKDNHFIGRASSRQKKATRRS